MLVEALAGNGASAAVHDPPESVSTCAPPTAMHCDADPQESPMRWTVALEALEALEALAGSGAKAAVHDHQNRSAADPGCSSR